MNCDIDQTEDEQYQAFVASMVKHCHCVERERPCDGVLAGGMCDRIGERPDYYDTIDELERASK